MTDDLQRLMDLTEGEGPSPAFRARLRAQVVAEGDGTSRAGIGHHPTSVDTVELGPAGDDHEGRRFLLRVAAVVLLVGLAALAVGTIDLGAPNESATESTMTESTLPTDTSVDVRDRASGLDPDAVLLSGEETVLEPGSYLVEGLGTPFSFEVSELTGLAANSDGVVSLVAFSSRGVADRTLTARRTSTLPGPVNPTSPDAGPWPATDLDGWVERLGRDVAASEITSVVVGGRQAATVDLRFACVDDECPPDEQTIATTQRFLAGTTYRVWVVEQGDEDPIVVSAAVADEADLGWFDVADGVVQSVRLGTTAPNPRIHLPTGPASLDVFDGVGFDLPTGATVVDPAAGVAALVPDEGLGRIELLSRPLDTSGQPVSTAEELIEILRGQAAELTNMAELTIDGVPAISFDVLTGRTRNVVLKTRPEDLARGEFGWSAPTVGAIWVIEHPDRGLLVIGADDGSTSTALRQWTDALLSSLSFESRSS